MDIILFLKGIFVGFLIAAPVGPVGILCIHRTLETGLKSGLASGIGAAAADTVFGGVAAFGLAFVADTLLANEGPLRLAGGVLLLIIGIRTLYKEPRTNPEPLTGHKVAGDFMSTFVLTITNPITILAFGPVFVAVGAVVKDGSLLSAWSLIIGVLAGSALWWLTLCLGVSLFRTKLKGHRVRWLNRISGTIIMVFGILVLASLTEWGRMLIGAPKLVF